MPLFNEAMVNLWIGATVFDGVKPAPGAGINQICYMKNINIPLEVTKKDVSGACLVVKNRYGKESGEMTVGSVLDTSGLSIWEPGAGLSPLRHPVWMEIFPLSGLLNSLIRIGVITKWDTRFADEEADAEDMTVDLYPDWI